MVTRSRASSRRCVQRHKRRLMVRQDALLQLVACCSLARVSRTSPWSRAIFDKKVAQARRVVLTSPYAHRHLSSSSSPLPNYNNDLYLHLLPGICVTLFNNCGLATTLKLSTAWQTLHDNAKLYSRRRVRSGVDGLSNRGDALNDLKIRDLLCENHYSYSALKKEELLSPIVADKVSLPSPSHSPIPLMGMLPWPLSVMFSEGGFQELALEWKKVLLSSINAYTAFDTPSEAPKLYKMLQDRSMMSFSSEVPFATNGLFAIRKPSGKLRLLCDMRRGNFIYMKMALLQEIYTRHLMTRGGPEACGLSAKILDLVCPSRLGETLQSVLCKTESDLADFYHHILVPPHMQECQALSAVSAASVGMPGDGVVYPRLTTLAMGFVYAPLLAQAVHQYCLNPAICVVKYRRHPTSEHMSRVRDLASVAVDGMIKIKDVPSDLISSLLTSHGLKESAHVSESCLEVPLSALTHCELATIGSDEAVTLVPLDVRDDNALICVHDVVHTCAHFVLWMYLLYIDDHHSFFRSSLPASDVFCFANTRLLVSLLAYISSGLYAKQEKVLWAHVNPSKTLGYETMMGPTSVRLATSFVNLELLRQKSLWVLRKVRNDSVVYLEVRFVQHLCGGWVWACLVNRCLLSIMVDLFRVTIGKSPTDVVRVTRRMCNELRLLIDLVPSMYGESRAFCKTLTAFDASSKGYGVAYRKGASEVIMTQLSTTSEMLGSARLFTCAEDGTPSAERMKLSKCHSSVTETTDFISHDWSMGGDNTWRVARSGRFVSIDFHITLKEALAGKMDLNWLLSQPALSHGRRLVILGDNQSVMAAFSKGRSSSRVINAVCQYICAACVSAGVSVTWVWIRSSANPGDGPSRFEAVEDEFVRQVVDVGCVPFVVHV